MPGTPNPAGTYGIPEVVDITIKDVGSLKDLLSEGGFSLTPEELEAVWNAETTTGGEY